MNLRSVLALVFALPTLASAAASSTDRASAVERGLLPPVVTERTKPMRIDDRLRHYRVAGVSVAVVDDGRLAWARAWGHSNSAQRVPMTAVTLLQSGSIAKPVAALGALKLVDQGRLALDTDVNHWLHTWRLPASPWTVERPVTVRGLLSHDAGLTVGGFGGYLPGAALPTLAQVLDGTPPANSPPVRVDKAPGSGWRYSGGGYVLLQQLMDDVTGEPFAAWMQREVLRPSGMESSLYGALPDAPATRVAAGHQNGRPIAGLRQIYPEQTAAGMLTTPTDLARLTLQLQAALAGQDQAVIRPATAAQAMSVQSRGQGMTMGLGFFLEGGDGQAGFGHNGSNAGFESIWRADRRRAVIVMANANGAGPLMDEIARAVAQAHGWADWQAPRVAWRELAAAYDREPLFLRGTMNEWGVNTPLRAVGAARFAVVLNLPAGATEFKFASEDWRTVNLGADFAGGSGRLENAGRNLKLAVATPGRYRFELDARNPEAPRYSVKRLP